MTNEVINIAIVGHGYVGKAVSHGFNSYKVSVNLIDPIYNTNVKSLDGLELDAAFVCVPTPFGKDGKIDSSIVEEVVKELAPRGCPIIIKSTVTPDVLEKLWRKNKMIVYNPEFLTEKNALNDFVNPPMHVFGGSPEITKQVEKIYEKFSRCKPCPVFHMSIKEASFVKYGINSFLATKVLWFNQFKDLIDQNKSDYDSIIKAIGTDNRIGFSHTQVPGPDNKVGFGGACFPKDTQAFSSFAKNNFTILDKVIEENNKYRSQYELDDREKEQKVVYINP
tara:strand:+ start:2557 stop:3393 length:837 start_codon:yes stop_codon:yes gene_type:complete